MEARFDRPSVDSASSPGGSILLAEDGTAAMPRLLLSAYGWAGPSRPPASPIAA